MDARVYLHPKLAFVTANFRRLSVRPRSAPTSTSSCILPNSALLFLLVLHATPTPTPPPMPTPEPDNTLDHTAPAPNTTSAPATPPDKPAEAAPNGASQSAIVVPQVNVNGEPLQSPRPSGAFALAFDPDSSTWGANFWVTLIDPQVRRVPSSAPLVTSTTVVAFLQDQHHVLCMSSDRSG